MRVLIFLVLGCLALRAETPPPRVVVVEKVDYHDLIQTARLIGTVRATSEAVFTAHATGTLVHSVSAGDKVMKGDLIAWIDNVDLHKNYDLATRAEQIAKQQYDRTATLVKSGMASQKMFEGQQNELLSAQKAVSDANIEREKTRFVAPFDGIVGVFKVRSGGQVVLNTVLVTVYDPSSLAIDLDIPESILPFIQKEQTLFVQGKPYGLTAVQKIIDPDTHMAPAVASYQCENCVIGSNIEVDLVIQERKHVLTVPVDALSLRDDKTFVFIVKDNKAQLRLIKTGLREKDRIEVTEGLEAGELIVKEKASIYNGSDVRIAETS